MYGGNYKDVAGLVYNNGAIVCRDVCVYNEAAFQLEMRTSLFKRESFIPAKIETSAQKGAKKKQANRWGVA